MPIFADHYVSKYLIMLSTIISSLKDNVSGELIEKAGVSQDQLPKIFDQIGSVAQEKLGGELASGNIGSLMNLFSNNSNSSSADGIQTALTSGIVSKLAGNFGIDKNQAASIANIVIPKLLGMITNKNSETPDSDSSFLSNMLGGGDASDLMGKAKDALGGFFK